MLRQLNIYILIQKRIWQNKYDVKEINEVEYRLYNLVIKK